jgi:hypothetical protein
MTTMRAGSRRPARGSRCARARRIPGARRSNRSSASGAARRLTRARADVDRHIEQQGQIGRRAPARAAPARDVVVLKPGRALVGIGRIGEAIAEHPAAGPQLGSIRLARCTDRAANISSSSATRRQRLIARLEHELADPLGQRRAAGFARHHVIDAAPRSARRAAPPASSCRRPRCLRRSRSGRSLHWPLPAQMRAAQMREVVRNRGVLLLERRGKHVAAVALARGDEIQRVGRLRMRARADRRADARRSASAAIRRAYRCCRVRRCADRPCASSVVASPRP